MDTPKTWSDANAYCQSNFGTTLATLTSDVEAQQLAEKQDFTDSDSPWIGLSDIEKEGKWSWASGHSWFSTPQCIIHCDYPQ